MKKLVFALAAAAGLAASADVHEDRAKEICAKMTLEEKVSLLAGCHTMKLRAVPRVGIPNDWVFSDSSACLKPLHVRWTWDYEKDVDDTCTVLPMLQGLASTWNTALAAEHGRVMGEQARDLGKDMLLGPGVNIMRNPLCGRNWEYMTEDPFLAARLVVPVVKGIQACDVAATVKHFAANSQEWNRTGVDTEVDERTMREIYLPAFRAAVQEGGALAVMNAYNKFRGEFCSASKYLQTQVLREEWGFKGFVVTDWGAMHDTVGPALAGCDVEMNRGDGILYYANPKKLADAGFDDQVREGKKPAYVEGGLPLADAVRAGKVPEAKVDEMVRHVLYVMSKTGALGGRERCKGARHTADHAAVARKIGDEAMVLLKNGEGVLPLDAGKLKTVLVLGSLNNWKHCMGGWSAEGKPKHEVTPIEGIRTRLGKDVKVVAAPLGSGDEPWTIKQIPENCIVPDASNKEVVGFQARGWAAEYYAGSDLKGEPVKGFRNKVNNWWGRNAPAKGLKGDDWSARWTARVVAPETGRFVISTRNNPGSGSRVKVDGKVLFDDWKGERYTFASGEIALERDREYKFEVEYRRGKGDSFVNFGWQAPSSSGMKIEEVRKVAATADAVIVLTGTVIGHGRAQECEGGDRPDLRLPEGHDAYIEKILDWKVRNLVIVVHSGSPCELPWADRCATILQQPYLGQEAGRCLADVLFGDVNPSGKLPCTWPRKLADTPVAQKGTYNAEKVVYNERFYVGYRWYDHEKIEPMFPFGYGISYTKFAYGKAAASSAKLGKNGSVEVMVPVKNTGSREGAEIVQLYVSPVKPKVERCEQELKGFDKVFLRPGETGTAKMTVTPRDFAYYDVASKRFRADAGEYRISVGASSRDVKDTVTVRLIADWTE